MERLKKSGVRGSNRNPENKNSLSQIKIKLEATPADWNKWKTEFQDSKTK
jgi:hypothetical protein